MPLIIKIILTYIIIALLIGGGMGAWDIANGFQYSHTYHVIAGSLWISPIPIIMLVGLGALWTIK